MVRSGAGRGSSPCRTLPPSDFARADFAAVKAVIPWSKDNKLKRARRRSLAEQVQDLRRKEDALERKSQQEQERRQIRAKDIVRQKLTFGLSWLEIEHKTGIDYKQLQRDVRIGGAEAKAYFINKIIDDPELRDAFSFVNAEGKKRRRKARSLRISLHGAKEKPPGD
jgi:hypothetical protein